MNKYNGLLTQIANDYSIKRGNREEVNKWKARIIYSFIGRACIASTFDNVDDESTSIVHLKSKAGQLLQTYRTIYPEVSDLFLKDEDSLVDEIYNVLLNTGTIYHRPNRVVSAVPTDGCIGGITFTRGYSLEEKQCVSGLGTYLDNEITQEPAEEMFFLDHRNLREVWTACLSNIQWNEYSMRDKTEFLRMTGRFSNGYWEDRPDKSARVSLMRAGAKGNWLYYLYKLEDGILNVSQLPQWMTEDTEYRTISNACLDAYSLLPPATAETDGNIVHVSFGYLPPPSELYFWKLYTWPSKMQSIPDDFHRTCDKKVYMAIKQIMELRGYHFVEE